MIQTGTMTEENPVSQGEQMPETPLLSDEPTIELVVKAREGNRPAMEALLPEDALWRLRPQFDAAFVDYLEHQRQTKTFRPDDPFVGLYFTLLRFLNGLLAGEYDWTFTTPDQGLPQIQAGRVKAYAITAKARMAQAPNVPTTDEAGLRDFYLSYWHGLWAPKGTPREIIGKLNAAVGAALTEPAVQRRLTELGQEIFPADQQTPEALGALQKAEVEKWWPLIKAAGITPE